MAKVRVGGPVRRLAALAVLLAFLSLFLAPAVRADYEAAVPDATAFTTQRKLVRLEDGSFVLAYVVQRDGENRVQVARSSDGATWTSLDPPSLGNRIADRPALAVDSRGRLHLAWTQNTSSFRQVFYASYADGTWSAAEQISDTVGYSGFPAVAVDSQDRVHVAWYGFDGLYYQIYYRRLGATGWGPQTAVTSESLDATNPALAVDARDDVHIVWYHTDDREVTLQVSYAILSGGQVSLETLSRPSDSALDPTLLVDHAGRVLVAWTSYAGGEERIAFTAKEDGTWSDPAAVTPSGLEAFHASLANDEAGNLYLFFQAGDGQVYLERETNGTWGAPQALTSGGQNTYPTSRWSFYPHWSLPGPPTVDVAWTEETGGAYRVRLASVGGQALPPTPAAFPVSDALFFGGLAAILAAFVLLGRRRR